MYPIQPVTNEPITWNNVGQDPRGITPLGVYDGDLAWVDAAPRVADFCARRLGYPVMDIELVDRQFYACFEEACMEYSRQVNEFNIRENMFLLQGLPTGSSITQKLIVGSPVTQVALVTSAYATEAEAGGRVQLQHRSIDLVPGQQDYDLDVLLSDVYESGSQIEIRKIFYQQVPPIARYYDPYATTGLGLTNLIADFGFGGYSPAAQFVLMPVFEDMLRIQGIEFNDMVRRAWNSFDLVGNKLRIFPIPTYPIKLWIDYYVVKDKIANIIQGGSSGSGENTTYPSGSVVSDPSNVPYTYIPYTGINDVGRMWILKYTFALSKETLGLIRSKYNSVPIPNGEVQLDGLTLRQEAQQEKEVLLAQLRESLQSSGREAQMEKMSKNAEAEKNILKYTPLYIWIG